MAPRAAASFNVQTMLMFAFSSEILHTGTSLLSITVNVDLPEDKDDGHGGASA